MLTPLETLKRIQAGKIDQRVLRHAVRLNSLVHVVGVIKGRPAVITSYEECLEATSVDFALTRRGQEMLS